MVLIDCIIMHKLEYFPTGRTALAAISSGPALFALALFFINEA